MCNKLININNLLWQLVKYNICLLVHYSIRIINYTLFGNDMTVNGNNVSNLLEVHSRYGVNSVNNEM